ncbi:MAG: pimeloyl-ACP methyl ester carboxylesterase [Patiriisocius sp.]|jgi:pimeloyl-ACP methyl ester carboxylesterase
MKHTYMRIMLLIALCIMTTNTVLAQTTQVIYQSDFDSDPLWNTDEPHNFYHQASTSALYAHIENTPPAYTPSRYYEINTTLDPTQSFTLSYDMQLLDFDVDGVAIFGLYTDTLESIDEYRVQGKVGEGTLNMSVKSLNGSPGHWDLNIHDVNQKNKGAGGSKAAALMNTWYEIVMQYDAASSTVHLRMQEKDTETVWIELARGDIVFPPEMTHLGISMHPEGEPRTVMSVGDRPLGSSNFLIDNVLLTQDIPEEPELGASNVLFLPGIQASRLYKDGLLGSEDRVWEPNISNDVLDLRMDESGVSENDIYTRDILTEVFGVSNIYAGLSSFMDDLVNDDVIEQWTPFAYDWRYDVFDIVENGTQYENETRYPIAELERLAADSKSGKVSIVAHSNGGLLAKAIMLQLEADSMDDLVDQIIFIGTPHLGTPKAIGTVLHGYDQEAVGGLVIDDADARAVIKDLPGVYGLLPSAGYIDKLNQPLVVFDNSSSTKAFRDYYGFGVNGVDEFTDFLNGEEDTVGRESVPRSAINEPSVVNEEMLDVAQLAHTQSLDSWEAPEGIDVHQIVGTGLATIKSIEYREVLENENCAVVSGLQFTCDVVPRIKPYAQITLYGDETVVSASGEGVRGVASNHYLDLDQVNADKFFVFKEGYKHADMSEVEQVQDLVRNIITGTSTEIRHVTTSEPDFFDAYDLTVVDSPVQITSADEEGNVTGVVQEDGLWVHKQEIPGSRYFEFGGSKYLIIPSDISRTTTLTGEEYGGYTLTIATLDEDDVQTVEYIIVNASTTPDMVAQYTKDQDGYSTISTDLDGDGLSDNEMTVDGEEVDEGVITYDTLWQAIENLDLPRRHERPLLRRVALSERFSLRSADHPRFARVEKRFLKLIQRRIKKYERRDIVDAVSASEIITIIAILKHDA